MGTALPAATATDAIRDHSFCTQNQIAGSDDGSSPQVTLPFAMNFFGNTYNSLYVNNNGNVTFNDPQADFTPSALTGNTGRPIIAAYFADVDTRNSGSQKVTYGSSSNQFCVNWVGVGFYNQNSSKLISAQLVITDRSSETGNVGDVEVELNYSDIQWETGDVSGGENGLGGISSAVGYSAGTGVLGTYSQFAGSLEPGSLIDGGPHALITSSRNSSVLGRYIFNVGGEIPLPEGSINGQVTDRDGDPLAASIEVCPAGGGACTTTVASGAGNYSAIGLQPGDYVVTATGPVGSGLLPRTSPITVSSGENSSLDFVLYATLVGSLEISVVDMNGDLVDGAIISVCDESTSDCLSAVPNSTDSAPIVLANIPVGNYDISVTAPTGSSLLDGTGAAIVAEDETSNASVTLLPQTNNTISGVVVDQNGDPVQATLTLFVVESAGDAVLAEDSPFLGTGSNPQQTAADGAFEWTVASGDYSVSAATEFCGETAQSVSFDNDGNATVTLTVSCPREAVPTTPDTSDDAGDTALEKTDGNGPYVLAGLAVAFLVMGGGLLLSRRRS